MACTRDAHVCLDGALCCATDVFGTDVGDDGWFAGGGGGSCNDDSSCGWGNGGSGKKGGGGDGNYRSGSHGKPNTGGGCGASERGVNEPGKNGGSGMIILRYASRAPPPVSTSGGVMVTDAFTVRHLFTSSSTFTTEYPLQISFVMIVGGGGGCGYSMYHSGGGGAGGLVYGTDYTLTAGTCASLAPSASCEHPRAMTRRVPPSAQASAKLRFSSPLFRAQACACVCDCAALLTVVCWGVRACARCWLADTITIGAGGVGSQSTGADPAQGGASIAFAGTQYELRAEGGGQGQRYHGNCCPATQAPGSGGSGGGAGGSGLYDGGYGRSTQNAYGDVANVQGFGHDGGDGVASSVCSWCAAGGGGAGGAGTTPTSSGDSGRGGNPGDGGGHGGAGKDYSGTPLRRTFYPAWARTQIHSTAQPCTCAAALRGLYA